jgi:Ca2+-binding RTX toxin-like protein
LSQLYFANIGATLDVAEFQIGVAANDQFDRIIYNQSTGQLYYDADGLGGDFQTLFAVLTMPAGQPLPALTIDDFVMF